MYVTRNMKELLVCFDRDCLKFSLKKRTIASMLNIVIFHIAIANFANELTNSTFLELPYKKMKMIWHQAITDYFNNLRITTVIFNFKKVVV